MIKHCVSAIITLTFLCDLVDTHPHSRETHEFGTDVPKWDRELWEAGHFDNGGRIKCGTKEPTREEMLKSDEVLRKWEARLPVDKSLPKDDIIIPVYFHIIETDDGEGGVSNKNINTQVKIMNKRMNNFQFELQNITRTRNSVWYVNEEVPTASKMINSLRVGGFSTLNIFVAGPPNYWGWAENAPVWESDYLSRDYVMLHMQALPLKSDYPWVKGYIALHETGHWLGLYHTFQNGCDGDGDFVSDTAPEAVMAQGCPKGRDTCPDDDLKDPIDNYMDYSYDSCQNKFTKGQIKRMLSYWDEYRKPDPEDIYDANDIPGDDECAGESKKWRKGKKTKKDCSWVAKNPEKRCNMKGKEGKRKIKASKACHCACPQYSE